MCKFPSGQDFLYKGKKMLENCRLCPRDCAVNRDLNGIGYCGESKDIRIAKTSLHMWEEPCISGKNGSGTVFFTGCNMKCIFCQNYNIADNDIGVRVSEEKLAELMLRLQEAGATNINLVTAGHFLIPLRESLVLAKKKGLIIPIVYNSSAYEKVESLKLLEGLVDIYLPDCKFMDTSISKNYANAADYFSVAIKAIDEMLRQTGKAKMTVKDDGNENWEEMLSGVIVRHMVIPGHTKDSMNILKYLHNRYGDQLYISIMNQYTPVIKQKDFLNLNRKLTKREYEKVVDYAIEIGIERAFIQEGNVAKESFIPEFDMSFI